MIIFFFNFFWTTKTKTYIKEFKSNYSFKLDETRKIYRVKYKTGSSTYKPKILDA